MRHMQGECCSILQGPWGAHGTAPLPALVTSRLLLRERSTIVKGQVQHRGPITESPSTEYTPNPPSWWHKLPQQGPPGFPAFPMLAGWIWTLLWREPLYGIRSGTRVWERGLYTYTVTSTLVQVPAGGVLLNLPVMKDVAQFVVDWYFYKTQLKWKIN